MYEELSGFIAHTKLAFKSFAYLTYHVVKIFFAFVFGKILFYLLEKIIWLIFLIIVFTFTVLAFIGGALRSLINKSRSPFGNVANRTRLTMLDKIKEKKKFSLCLGMDGTLIFASKVRKERVKRGIKCEKISLEVVGEKNQNIYLYPRPYLEEFLSRLSDHFNIYIFTTSEEVYMNRIVDHFDKWQVIKERFDRNYCDSTGEKTMHKNLKRVFPSGTSNVIMVEHMPNTCIQKENVITVSRWEAKDAKDTDLKHVCEFLLENIENVQKGVDLVELYEVKLKNHQAMEAVTKLGGKEEDEEKHPDTEQTSILADESVTINVEPETPDQSLTGGRFEFQRKKNNFKFEGVDAVDQDTIKAIDTDNESRCDEIDLLPDKHLFNIQILTPMEDD